YTQLEIPEFRDILIHHMESVKKSIDKRALHKRDDDFPLPEQLPTANEDKFPLLIQSDATAEELCAAAEEVIEFGDSYKAPTTDAATGSASEGTATKKGRTVALTTKDMQKRKNDVKARTTLLLALPVEHQLRFKGSKTLEQTFNRLHAIVRHLQFMDIEIKQDDLNQKFLTSLAPEWLIHTIVWRNRSDLDTMSLDDLYNHLKVYESEVQKKSESNSQNMAFISSAKNSSGKEDVNTASIPTASTNVSPASVNIRAAPKALMVIDGVGWDWSFMANKEEDHALVADEEAPIEFALMAKTSAESEDTITYYTRPSPSVESNPNDLQNSSSSTSENGESTGGILSKPEIKFVRPADSPTGEPKKLEQFEVPTVRPPMRPVRPNMNVAQPKRTSFHKLAHSYSKRPFQRTSAVRSQFRAPRVPTVTRKFPTVNRKFPTVNRKFPTGNTKFSTANLGNKGTAGNSQNHIDDKGYWDSGFSWHMTGNLSYHSDYEPFDGGYVSFGQGGCKIIGKGTIKTGKLEFENVYFVKDLKYNLFSVSQICDNKNSVLFTDSECIVLGRDFKLTDDTNVLLRTPRQHNMYSTDLNNIVLHKDLTCLVAKASADECMLWHRRLGKCTLSFSFELVLVVCSFSLLLS
nr:ribonuclease H-like domain-containing protein [Tanacetum cinerariifolium]